MVLVWPGKNGATSPLWAFDGHIDTVGVKDTERDQWTQDPLTPRRVLDANSQEFYYGKGAVDQGGGWIAALKACLEIGAQIPKEQRIASFAVILTRMEEMAEGWGSRGAVAELEKRGYSNLQGVVLTEPSRAQIITGQIGRIRLKISNKSDGPDLLAKAIGALEKYSRIAKITTKPQALTLIGGDLVGNYDGTIDSQVPDRAFLSLRSTDHSDERKLSKYLEELKNGGHIKEYPWWVSRDSNPGPIA